MIYRPKENGFTIIEVIVVIAVTAIILPVFFNIIFSLFRLQYQNEQLKRIKEIGDYVSDQTLFLVRQNANTVDDNNSCLNELSVPAEVSQYLFFRDRGNECFGFYFDNGKLEQVSNSGTVSNNVTLISGGDLDYAVAVDESTSQMKVINDTLAQITLVLKSEPRTDYLKAQTLTYQYYIYIRR